MREFLDNPELSATMETHLIHPDTFGVWEDDYEKFFRQRSQSISESLQKWIIPRSVDNQTQAVSVDDYEEAEEEAQL